jgi:hypothetical protein
MEPWSEAKDVAGIKFFRIVLSHYLTLTTLTTSIVYKILISNNTKVLD